MTVYMRSGKVVKRGGGMLSSVLDDWAQRSTAPGVVLADRLETSTKLVAGSIDATHWVLNNGTEDHVHLDTAVKVPGAAGSWRLDVADSDSTAAGDIGVYFGNLTTFTFGDTFWYSYRELQTAEHTFQEWPSGGGPTLGGNGAKHSIMSNHAGSNQVNEIVIEDTYNCNTPTGYHQDGSAYPPDEEGRSTSCNGGDVVIQPQVDRGVNPLTGNNPDTGTAWTTTCVAGRGTEQERGRWGVLYSSRSSPGVDNYARGLGDPFTGGVRTQPDEFMTFIERVIPGTAGAADSRRTCWLARLGQPPIKLWDRVGITLGNGPVWDTQWLLSYCSNRTSGGVKVSARTFNIGGIRVLNCGLATPQGDGVLSYDASTQRFTWAASGQTAGTARGFSVANGFMWINLKPASGGGHLLIQVQDPSSLPPSGVTNDTVTIANGRVTSSRYYNDVIISTQVINTPGGFAPVG